MNLFSELYGCYYQVVSRILESSCNTPIKKQEIQKIIDTYGFKESGLMIIPKLISGEWSLLYEPEDGLFLSKIHSQERLPFTNLQKAWLKSLLTDLRFQLFFNQKDLNLLQNELHKTEPLYQQNNFHYFDQCLDGDPYDNTAYQNNFRFLMKSIESNYFLTISYQTYNSNENIRFRPFRIQYSGRDDRFYLLGVFFTNNKPSYKSIPIADILLISKNDDQVSDLSDFDDFYQNLNTKEITTIEISGKRNSLERCMLHFANYEKQTIFNEKKSTHICTIHYDKTQENDLLLQILSFGATIKIIDRSPMFYLAKEQIKKQYKLLNSIIKE